MAGERERDDTERDLGDTPPATNDESRALHPSAGQVPPEQFRRCDRHWFDPAVAGCDDCGRALCPDCVVAIEGLTTLCDACTVVRSTRRVRSRILERRREQGKHSGTDT